MIRYIDFVRNLSKPGEEIRAGLSAEDAHILHMCLGLSGEVGELIDAFKKHIIYGKPFDRENAEEEIGDALFYLQGICNAIGYSFGEAMRDNMDKLTKRYPSGYTNTHAIMRADKMEQQKPKILILGYAQHGKDTFAALLLKALKARGLNLEFMSSSDFAFERAVWPYVSHMYVSKDAAYADKANARMHWHQAIKGYNAPDPARLCKELLSQYDMYVGMRSMREYEAAKDLFTHTFVVDASGRGVPRESHTSCDINLSTLEDVLLIDNSRSEEELIDTAIAAAEIILRSHEPALLP